MTVEKADLTLTMINVKLDWFLVTMFMMLTAQPKSLFRWPNLLYHYSDTSLFWEGEFLLSACVFFSGKTQYTISSISRIRDLLPLVFIRLNDKDFSQVMDWAAKE